MSSRNPMFGGDMTADSGSIYCPTCEQMVPHDRGYLTEHMIGITRGQLVVGNRLCDGSNTKPPMSLKTVRFTGLCTNCLTTNTLEFREKFPGSLEQYGGVMHVNCSECGPEADYCTNCDHQLHETKSGEMTTLDGTDDDLSAAPSGPAWVNDLGEATCPDGATHQNVHRPEANHPVLLTDNHIIVPSDDPVPA